MSEAKQVSSDASGIGAIRTEHQVQIGLLRALEQVLRDGDRNGNAAEVLEQLKVFTNVHFLSEQLLMRLHGYADYETHCQEHEALLEVLDSVQKSFELQSASERKSKLDVFADCLKRHIASSDDALERFVSTIIPS